MDDSESVDTPSRAHQSGSSGWMTASIDEGWQPRALKLSDFTFRTVDFSPLLDDTQRPRRGSMDEAVSLPLLNSGQLCREVRISRVLVLYTGGTIGMCNVNGFYKPQANFLCKALRRLPMFNDRTVKLTDQLHPECSPFVMPLSRRGVRVIFVVNEYSPLLDSSDMAMDDYIQIAHDIKQEYANYDGFIVLHGTDTMAYSASALSFLLENLGKPVIITGSQIPIFEIRSDGRDNFLGALQVIGHHPIPEVAVYFHNKVYRGNRVTKCSICHFDAFDSPNYPPLMELGLDIQLHMDRILRPNKIEAFNVHTQLCRDVAVLRIFPSITSNTVDMFLQPPIKGVVMQTFGAGNIPSTRKDILEALQRACERGCIIVNISQCPQGAVEALYEAGSLLKNVGVIPGQDMTVEAALTKLAYVLSKTEWSVDEQRRAMAISLRGELTPPKAYLKQNLTEVDLMQRLAEVFNLHTLEETKRLKDTLMPTLLFSAATNGDLESLKKFGALMEHFEVHDYYGRTPLHLAAGEGHVEIVRFLLGEGALVHCVDRFGVNPLMYAIRFRHPKVVELLLQAGGHLTLSDFHLASRLNRVCAQGDVELLKLFHKAGARMDLQDYDGRSPLHVAALYLQVDVVLFLLSPAVRCSPFLRNKQGLTALEELVANQDADSNSLASKLIKKHLLQAMLSRSEVSSTKFRVRSQSCNDMRDSSRFIQPL